MKKKEWITVEEIFKNIEKVLERVIGRFITSRKFWIILISGFVLVTGRDFCYTIRNAQGELIKYYEEIKTFRF